MATDTGIVLSRFAFIFLIYSVITSGYIGQVLSCQMQHFLSISTYFRHVLGVVMVFVFIMMEGGWSFTEEEEKEKDIQNDWSSGNVFSSFAIASIIYTIFLVSSKSQLVPSLVFFTITLILYVINTQRSYWLARNKITKETSESVMKVERVMLIAAIAVLVYGFVDYVLYQQKNYGTAFSWHMFLLGSNKCKSQQDL